MRILQFLFVFFSMGPFPVGRPPPPKNFFFLKEIRKNEVSAEPSSGVFLRQEATS